MSPVTCCKAQVPRESDQIGRDRQTNVNVQRGESPRPRSTLFSFGGVASHITCLSYDETYYTYSAQHTLRRGSGQRGSIVWSIVYSITAYRSPLSLKTSCRYRITKTTSNYKIYSYPSLENSKEGKNHGDEPSDTMGLTISNLFNRLFGKQNMRILMGMSSKLRVHV